MTIRAPFWDLQTLTEVRMVRALLRRRFPETFSLLAESLEQADPCRIVYPDNPGEYDGVVREVLVLLASRGGSVAGLPVDEIETLIAEGLARSFGETAPQDGIRRVAELVASGVRE